MMASLNPAKSVHIDDVCGQIREGYDADFIVLDQIWIWLRPISMGSNVTRRRIRFKNRR